MCGRSYFVSGGTWPWTPLERPMPRGRCSPIFAWASISPGPTLPLCSSLRTRPVLGRPPAGARRLEHHSKLIDLAAVRGPVAGALRGDRAVVMLLRLVQQLLGCTRRRGGRARHRDRIRGGNRRADRRASAEQLRQALLE